MLVVSMFEMQDQSPDFSDMTVVYWLFSHAPRSDANHLTMRWSERRTAVRSTFEMISTLPLRATRGLVRRRSSCSR